MASGGWNWKNKDGRNGGLLYESGNWGDLLKLLWLVAVVEWKQDSGRPANYFDPFAGDVCYPLGVRAAHRLRRTGPEHFALIERAFLQKGFWPSAASAAALTVGGALEIWDADPGRRDNWRGIDGVSVPEGESGWQLLEARLSDPDGVWLLDPYDFLAEWRDWLPLVVEKANDTSVLLYLYNRSGKNAEAFAGYRAFRNALDDLRGELPKRLGRVAADGFLPRSHHEMLFLPGAGDRRNGGLERLFDELERVTAAVNAGLARAAVFDC